MSLSSSSKVAVLGLGIIGSRAYSCLRNAGWQAVCWNRTPKDLEGETATPEEAATGAAIISLYLKDAFAVREIITRIIPHLQPGQIVLNHSTIDLATTLWLDGTLGKAGCRFLDAPFTGSKDASAGGKLLYYLGGDPSLIDELAAYLSVTSRSVLPCGKAGDATVVKLAMNLISACTLQALAEGLAITSAHGISKAAFADAAADSAFSSMLTGMKLPGMLSGDYETHFSMVNMLKDSHYALTLADGAQLQVPAISAVSARMEELCDAGLADLDFSAVAKPYLEPYD